MLCLPQARQGKTLAERQQAAALQVYIWIYSGRGGPVCPPAPVRAGTWAGRCRMFIGCFPVGANLRVRPPQPAERTSTFALRATADFVCVPCKSKKARWLSAPFYILKTFIILCRCSQARFSVCFLPQPLSRRARAQDISSGRIRPAHSRILP